MRVAAQKYLRDKNIIPANRWLKVDTFGTGRTQERRRPDRFGETPVGAKLKGNSCERKSD